jgi:hypothetical protein
MTCSHITATFAHKALQTILTYRTYFDGVSCNVFVLSLLATLGQCLRRSIKLPIADFSSVLCYAMRTQRERKREREREREGASSSSSDQERAYMSYDTSPK